MNQHAFLFIVCLLFSVCANAQKTLQLMDGDSTFTVPFVLKSGAKKFQSDSQGKLVLQDSDLNLNANASFTLEFLNDLDWITYSNKLFFRKGNSDSDPHVAFTNLRLGQLFLHKATVFYMRNKTNRVDD